MPVKKSRYRVYQDFKYRRDKRKFQTDNLDALSRFHDNITSYVSLHTGCTTSTLTLAYLSP